MRLSGNALWLVVTLLLFAVFSVQAQEADLSDVQSAPHLAADPAAADYSQSWQQPLMPVFVQASGDYRVPLELLLALGQIGSGFENRDGAPTIERGYGIMALRENAMGGDSLALAASLTNTDAQQIKLDPVANIRGAAAVLDEYAHQAKVDRTAGVEAWVPAVVRYAGLDDESNQLFAVGIYERIRDGFEVTNGLGETFVLDPRSLAIDPADLAPPIAQMESSDYGPAIWDPAASCNYSAYYTSKDTVVVHTTEGSAAGARSWFKNCNASCSAHYVISQGGTIWQMVRESYKAWHAGCYNSRAIGLEHEGYASSSSHPTSQYNASGDLVRNICNDWGIPKEKRTRGPGIIGHIDVTRCCCGTHVDPGNGWNWTYYINRVKGTTPLVDNADFVSSTIPSTMTTGQKVTVTVKFKNNGTTTWTSSAGYKLGAVNGTDPFAPSTDALSGTIAPGVTASFSFTMTAPSTAGTYRSDWRMQKSGKFFGDTHAKDIVVKTPPPLVDDADFVSSTIPSSMSTEQSVSVTLKFKNSGTTTWTGSGGYKLAAVGGTDPFGSSSYALGSSESIAPGVTKTFTFTMKAPATAGTYRTDWRMAKGSTFFGDTFSKDVAVSVPPPTDDADFVSGTIPSSVQTGQLFTVSLTFKNSGTTTWTAANGYKLGAVGDSDPFTTTTRYLLNSGESVAPGQQRTFNVEMVAPSTAGTYTSDWRMVRESVHWFGDTHTKSVAVVAPPMADIIIESRTGGKNHGWYAEDGAWLDSEADCTATGCTANIGSRYTSTYRSVVGVRAAIYSPYFPATGHYKVYVAWADRSDLRTPIRHTITHAGGNTNVNIDQTGTANAWTLLGTFTFNAGYNGSLRISNEAIDVSGSMVASAARFIQQDGSPPPPTPPDVIIESRTSGKNYGLYEDNGMADLTDKSTAPGTTSGIGSRYASSSYWGKRAIYSASISQSGLYKIYATWSEDSRINCTDYRFFVDYDGITLVTDIDQVGSTNGNTWVLISGARPFLANKSTQGVISDNTDNTICPDSVIDRSQCPTNHFCVADAVKFVWAGSALPAPADLNATGGDKSAILTWSAVSGAASYQVLRTTEPGIYVGTGSIRASSLTTTTFNDTGLLPDTTYYYRVRAVDASGNPGFGSGEGGATTDPPPPAPMVSITADNVNIMVNESVVLTPSVTLAPGATAVEGMWEIISGGVTVGQIMVNGAPVAINRMFDSVGDYEVTLQVTDSNSQTGTSNLVVIHVGSSGVPPPTISQHPIGMTVCPAGTAGFVVAATGDPPLSYQWQKNNTNLVEGDHYSGITGPTLTITGADATDAGNYRCVVRNPGGSVYSNQAALTVANCDDGDPCTVDVCDPQTSQCSHTPLDCDDGNPNTVDACVDGECQHTLIVPQTQTVFSDGFNGNLNNWTQQVENFDYSTTVNHAGLTGAGSAYVNAGGKDQMYHEFARPFAQGKVSGWFYDGKGGWKAGVCGYSYRQALSLRDTDGAAKMFIDNEFYEATDSSKYFYRLLGGGLSGTHTAYATRNADTSCAAAWVCFQTTVTPGVPGASVKGTALLKVTDGSGTFSTTQNLGSDFFSYGLGRITLGLGVGSTSLGYWDDIKFEAIPPTVPSLGAPVVLSSSQIMWPIVPPNNDFFGYDVADAAGTIKSPQWPATGWLGHAATSWTETGLTANTQYTRKIRAWNGTLNSALWSGASTVRTLSVAPTAAGVTADRTIACRDSSVVWSAAGGFGAGRVSYYEYAWNQTPTYTFGGSEPQWSSGTLSLTASAPGTWYLHVRGFNGDDVPNGTYAYAITVPNCDDGNACTTDTCDPQTGECAHQLAQCDDGDPCTVDSCNPQNGMCLHQAMDCEDGDVNTEDSCTAGQCVHTPVDNTRPTLIGAVSRKTHGSRGEFDINVPLSGTTLAVECRKDGPTQVVLTFSEPVQAGYGSVSAGILVDGPGLDQKTVILEAAPNQTCIVLTLTDIIDLAGNPLDGDNDLVIRVLLGDVNGDGAVNVFDMLAVRNILNQAVTATNFRGDIIVDGNINVFDLLSIKTSMNTTVSCP